MKLPFILGLLISLLFLNLSCDQKKEDPGLGPQVNVIDIEIAQDQSLSKLDPYTVTQEVLTSQGPVKSISNESTIEVVDVENNPDARLITTLQKVLDLTAKDKFVYEVKNVFALSPIFEAPASRLKEQLNESFSVASLSKAQVYEAQIQGVSFHNLKTQQVVLVPPSIVKDSSDCRGLDPCEIPSDLISYDVVFHLEDGTQQKHSIEWFISTKVPFFAGILKQCATTLVPVEDLRVLVKQCDEVVDFNP
ncbi:MAG: hypothetical protein MJK18_14275 [Bdellovibrionales bacterium]|nr:hypothetical protein [Bdellovibrionales bacterium]